MPPLPPLPYDMGFGIRGGWQGDTFVLRVPGLNVIRVPCEADAPLRWKIVQRDPPTIVDSVKLVCGDGIDRFHGFITDGKWVPTGNLTWPHPDFAEAYAADMKRLAGAPPPPPPKPAVVAKPKGVASRPLPTSPPGGMPVKQVAALGRVVHVNIGTEGSPVLRPAIIARVWDVEHGKVNLQLLTDGENDRRALEVVGLIPGSTPSTPPSAPAAPAKAKKGAKPAPAAPEKTATEAVMDEKRPVWAVPSVLWLTSCKPGTGFGEYRWPSY